MKNILFLTLVISGVSIYSQSWKGSKEYYPIHTKPSIGYMSSMNSGEEILFDAKPSVYYSFWNNMFTRITGNNYKTANAIYALFQPHIRMYDEGSLPVKMPSYRVGFGWQILRQQMNDNFYVFGFETGHYSNGQSGCAFAEGVKDETSDCSNIHATISPQSNLARLLNRDNGNFSTNWSKASFNYRINIPGKPTKDKDGNEKIKPRMAHSFTASYELYHNRMFGIVNIGGFSSDFDIQIYGRHRFNFGYEFIHNYGGTRYSIETKIEYISNPHEYVNPFRGEITGIGYFWDLDFGLYLSFVTGHDNYNLRFVDSGNQLSIGVVWDLFAPISREHAKSMDNRKKSKT